MDLNGYQWTDCLIRWELLSNRLGNRNRWGATLNPGPGENKENAAYFLLLQTALDFISDPGFNNTELRLESKRRQPDNLIIAKHLWTAWNHRKATKLAAPKSKYHKNQHLQKSQKVKCQCALRGLQRKPPWALCVSSLVNLEALKDPQWVFCGPLSA